MNAFKTILIIMVTLLLGLSLGRIWQTDGKQVDDAATENEALVRQGTFSCSMHPQIQQPRPGSCPICGMNLVPLESVPTSAAGKTVLEMDESAKARAAIETSPVTKGFPTKTIRLFGKLEQDETRRRTLAARFPARIETLFANFTGIRVAVGDTLAEIYSPELLAAQRELLTAYRIDPESSFTRAAREKLLLWDLQPEQIDALLEDGVAKDHFFLKAPLGGVVVAKEVQEGDYVKTGQALMGIMDFSQLWVVLDANESDLPWLRYGQNVNFRVEALPGEVFSGRVDFIEPEVNPGTRSLSLRLKVDHSDGRLKPGMFVRARVDVKLAAAGAVYDPELSGKWISPMHPEVVREEPGQCDICGMDLVTAESLGYAGTAIKATEAPLLIPATAVLYTGKRSVVYVQKSDRSAPLFEGREITLGTRAGEDYIVLAGLREGEQVVTQGAFKIDSALQIKAQPSMMSMPGAPHEPAAELFKKQDYPALLKPYLALQSALASDDYESATLALKSMGVVLGHKGETAERIHTMLAAKTIESIRRPHFELLSKTMIAAVRADPGAFENPLYWNHCSMVYPDRGADWLQFDGELRNPYWGAAMLHCGNTKEVFEK